MQLCWSRGLVACESDAAAALETLPKIMPAYFLMYFVLELQFSVTGGDSEFKGTALSNFNTVHN